MFKAQANSCSTITSFFNFLGFLSFVVLQPVQTAFCTYNRPDGTTGMVQLESGTHWENVWSEIKWRNINFQGSDWKLVALSKRDETDEDKIMRSALDGAIDGKWSAEAMRAVWEIANLNLEISGTFEITCGQGQNFASAGGPQFVKLVIVEITHSFAAVEDVDVQFQVLSDGAVNIDYTITHRKLETKSGADRIADQCQIQALADMTAFSFREAARKVQGLKEMREIKISIDEITNVKSKIAPTMARHAAAVAQVATINLQLGGKTVIDGMAGFAAKVHIQGSWDDTKAAILKQLGNSISEETHNILYSTVSQSGAKHDDKTNLSDKDTIYVSATPNVFSGNIVEKGSTADVKITAYGNDIVNVIIPVAIFSVVVIGVIFVALWYWHRRNQKKKFEIQLRSSQGTW